MGVGRVGWFGRWSGGWVGVCCVFVGECMHGRNCVKRAGPSVGWIWARASTLNQKQSLETIPSITTMAPMHGGQAANCKSSNTPT